MPKITALIHAHNHPSSLERALESLELCDEILVIDYSSGDQIAELARRHRAVVKAAVPGVEPGVYAVDADNDWILCLLPNETLSGSLQTGLRDWKETDHAIPSFAVAMKTQTKSGWTPAGTEVRLVDRTRVNWGGELPPNDPAAEQVPGELLRHAS